jgi:hypothetical protein
MTPWRIITIVKASWFRIFLCCFLVSKYCVKSFETIIKLLWCWRITHVCFKTICENPRTFRKFKEASSQSNILHNRHNYWHLLAIYTIYDRSKRSTKPNWTKLDHYMILASRLSLSTGSSPSATSSQPKMRYWGIYCSASMRSRELIWWLSIPRHSVCTIQSRYSTSLTASFFREIYPSWLFSGFSLNPRDVS